MYTAEHPEGSYTSLTTFYIKMGSDIAIPVDIDNITLILKWLTEILLEKRR